MSSAVLRFDDVSYHYPDGPSVLDGVSFELPEASLTALVGSSGSGKSTLLFLAGLLANPQAGEVYLEGEAVGTLGPRRRETLRNRTLGLVFQHHYLLGDHQVWENVAMPLWIQAGGPLPESEARARELLQFVGLEAAAERSPSQLSGGERQRVAVARALATEPRVLLADEPTGSLDSANGDRVFELLEKSRDEVGAAVLLVTHNLELASRCDSILRIEDGRIAEPDSN